MLDLAFKGVDAHDRGLIKLIPKLIVLDLGLKLVGRHAHGLADLRLVLTKHQAADQLLGKPPFSEQPYINFRHFSNRLRLSLPTEVLGLAHLGFRVLEYAPA